MKGNNFLFYSIYIENNKQKNIFFYYTVTVDYSRDCKADTGGFEIVHEMRLYEKHGQTKTEANKNIIAA